MRFSLSYLIYSERLNSHLALKTAKGITGMKKDELLYVSRCNCGDFGLVMRKDDRVQFFCVSCKKVRYAADVQTGQMFEQVYPDYYKKHLSSILNRIDPKFKIKPTITFLSLITALVGFIDLYGIKITCYQKELHEQNECLQGDLFIERWRKTRFNQ